MNESHIHACRMPHYKRPRSALKSALAKVVETAKQEQPMDGTLQILGQQTSDQTKGVVLYLPRDCLNRGYLCYLLFKG